MNSVISDKNSDTKTVIESLRNSHCIICGTPFNTARVGKLYCSSKCKQFGYNHKEEIINSKKNSGGINAKPQTFYLEDFQFYNESRKRLKRYKELSSKQQRWELAKAELINSESTGFPATNYTWEIYNSKKLSEDEDGELYELETDLADELKLLNLKEISIEQWSFIKALYPSLENISLCELIDSFGNSFFSQLDLRANDGKINANVTIKSKFINHCNLIADGIIRFIKKPGNDENEN